MADVHITREFTTTPQRLFEVVSQQEHILNWWGYDEMDFPAYALDLTRLGPWHFEMHGADGARFKLSGQVTKVDPPRFLGFTWAWHDEDDQRGAESHVSFTIDDLGDGRVRLSIDHRELSEEVAERHKQGWLGGPMPRLERYLGQLDD